MQYPSHAIRAFKYHYRRVPERSFITFIAKKKGFADEDVNSAYRDLEDNSFLWEDIESKLTIYPNSYGQQMTRELSSLYLLVRIIKPDSILETGVASGASSAYLLKALYDNNKGKLYSIDLPPKNLPLDKKSGWVVPECLQDRWNLHLGDAKELLKPVVQEIGNIDCFIHDSLHIYDHMLWEYNTIWEYLRESGLFLSHDVGASMAFFDFMAQKRVSWFEYRVFHVLGGFIK